MATTTELLLNQIYIVNHPDGNKPIPTTIKIYRMLANTMAEISTQHDHRVDNASSPVSGTLQAFFNYYAASTPPALNDISILLGTSAQTCALTLPVTDLRRLSTTLKDYHHETHGFQILHQKLPVDSSHDSVHDAETMTTKYFPAMSDLLKSELGVRSTAIVNMTMRDSPTSPFFISHADYTAAGSRAHLRAMTRTWVDESQTQEEREEFFRLRDEIIAAEDKAITQAGLDPASEYSMTGQGGHWDWDGKGYEGPRYAIFSVWRPWEVVKRDPLAIMLSPERNLEYAILPRKYKRREGYVDEYYSDNPVLRPPPEGYEFRHNWCYTSEQTPEEVYVIKLYDSEAMRHGDGHVRLMCPHSAFRLEGTEHLPPRRSCELRIWCIW